MVKWRELRLTDVALMIVIIELLVILLLLFRMLWTRHERTDDWIGNLAFRHSSVVAVTSSFAHFPVNGGFVS